MAVIQFLTAEASRPPYELDPGDEGDEVELHSSLSRLHSDPGMLCRQEVGACATSPPGAAGAAAAASAAVAAAVTADYLPSPVTNLMPVTRPQKAKKSKSQMSPPSPVVAQLVGMGFPRKKVEFAIKTLGM